MGKSVAVEGDVQATPGTTPFPPADKGSWTAGKVTVYPYEKLKVGEKKVIYKAQCTFTFTGTQTIPGTPPSQKDVSGTETVTLEAKLTKLQGAQSKVLVNGDNAQGTYGNQLKVTATNKLFTV
ncbi:hypothetical protein NDI44_22505 [Trichocoleus sp. DQ-A3]|uniref:hypothetical protein n=1 Tax=Cyanophyceae TaxID=3028117 RepID=UPI001689BC17|nr:hypothetical protein [Coleofasciculus sp. FACHB-125]MBD1903809.1 hypothetical protein [Coleofasciculus sp. FACHB-125]